MSTEPGAGPRSEAGMALRELAKLSAAATPGPWIRRWASLDVHHMTGDDALQVQADIDFAVHACAYVRGLLAAPDSGGHAEHFDPDCEECAYLARPTRESLALPDSREPSEREAIAADRTWASGYAAGRAAAERALPGAEERLRLFIEALPVGEEIAMQALADVAALAAAGVIAEIRRLASDQEGTGE